MGTANLEHDFLGLHQNEYDQHHHHSSSAQDVVTRRPILDRRRSFCGISKINPEIVKSVIANKSPSLAATSIPRALSDLPVLLKPVFPVEAGEATNYDNEKAAATPLTIIYKGTVSIFDLPRHKAEELIKFAMDGSGSTTEGVVINDHESSFNVLNQDNFIDSFNGDLPIKRKKSIHRFFEKRKERLISESPFSNHCDHMLQQLRQMKTST